MICMVLFFYNFYHLDKVLHNFHALIPIRYVYDKSRLEKITPFKVYFFYYTSFDFVSAYTSPSQSSPIYSNYVNTPALPYHNKPHSGNMITSGQGK